MVVLRCTQKLLVRLKRAEVSPSQESTTRLGDWYGNILRIGRQQHLLFISEHSRLPVIIPIREARRLETIFSDVVCAALSAVDVASDHIADERFARDLRRHGRQTGIPRLDAVAPVIAGQRDGAGRVNGATRSENRSGEANP